MTAQHNYNTHKNDLERYKQQGLLNGNDIAIFDEAKRIGEEPYSLAAGFPFKATEMMKNLLDDINKREAKEALANYQHNNGSTFRTGMGR